ncbi:MAG: hypothetical protein IPO22_02335 [Anaerolineales bacterium]|nr:hypothetical protein [Anaerolineales bacterium]
MSIRCPPEKARSAAQMTGEKKVPNLLVSGLDFFIRLKPWQVLRSRM